MSPNETKPESSASRRVVGAMPATPSPLLVSARIVPVTRPVADLVTDVAVVPDHVARIDDGDAIEVGVGRSTPESITATTTDGSPLVVFQASGHRSGRVALLGMVGVGRVAVVGHRATTAGVGDDGRTRGRRGGCARTAWPGLSRWTAKGAHRRGWPRRNADRGRGDALPDDDERPSKALASAAQRAPTVPEALAGAATPSTSADASSNAMRDLVDTVLTPSLSCGCWASE
jgi:hypothetical protein